MKTFRSLLRVLVVTCFAVFGSSVCEAQTPPVRILPLGDSLTAGNAIPGAYRNPLHTLLTTAGFNVDFVGTQTDTDNPSLPDKDHQGMGGYRIAQLRTGLPWWLQRIDDPDVVLLMIGTNDFSANDDIANASNRLASLVSDLATRLPHAKLIVATLPLRTDSPTLEAQQAAYNAAIPGIVADQISLGRQVSMADLHAALEPADLAEGVHPTSAGYAKLAGAWLPAITDVISPSGTADPPAVLRTGPATGLQQISITFSKPVADSAADPANFSIAGGLPVTGATLDTATKRTVTLATGTQTAGALHTITIDGVRDRTPAATPIAAGTTAYHTALTITNGSFENGEAGWSMTGNRLVYDSAAPYLSSHGSRMLIMNGGQTAPNAYISQNFGTVPGQTYRVEYDAGVLALNTSQQRLGVQITGNATHFAEAQVLAGNGLGNTVWVAKSHTFSADSTVTNLAFGDLSTTSNSIDLLLDNVRVTAVPPLVNFAPVAAADSFTTPVNVPLVIPAPGLLENDSDSDADPLSAVLDSAPAHGSLSLAADGGFTYTPDAGYIGPDSFTYHASDGALNSNVATVSLTIVSDVPPLLINGSFEEGETGWTMTGNYLVYGSDGTYIASDGNAMLVLNGGQSAPSALVSQPFPTVAGRTYTLEYDVGFVSFNTSTQRLGVQVNGAGVLLAETVSVSVTGNGQGRTVWIPKSHTFTADGTQTSLSFADLSATTTGIDLLLDNVRVTAATPPSNTAPAAAGDSYQTAAGTALVIAAPGVLANDGDAEGDALTAVLVAGTSHGSLALDAGGGFSYTPAAGFTGADSFTYLASDGELESTAATVDILVTPDTPGTLVNGGFEDGGIGWTMTGNHLVYESDGTYVASEGVSMLVLNGGQGTPNALVSQPFLTVPGETYTVTFDLGVLAFNTAEQRLGIQVTGNTTLLAEVESVFGNGRGDTVWTTRSHSFTADGTSAVLSFADLSTTTALIDLLLDNVRLTSGGTPSNTAPAAADDTYQTVSGTPLDLAAPGVLANDSDAENDALTAVLASGPSHGSLSLRADGSFLYTPAAAFTGTDSFTYRADDGALASAPATVSIDVFAPNAPPVAAADSYSIAAGATLVIPAPGLLANDHDPDEDPLTALLESAPAHGTLSLAADGGFTYTPAPGFTGSDGFTYRASDGGLESDPAVVGISVFDPAAELLVNGSFEDDYNGWSAAGVQEIGYYPTTDGIRQVVFNSQNRTPDATLRQDFPTVPGQEYTLSFDMGVLSYVRRTMTLRAVVTGAQTVLSRDSSLAGDGAGGIQWVSRSYTFVADGPTSTLVFEDRSGSTVGIDVLLDKVSVTGQSTGGNEAPQAVPDAYTTRAGTRLSIPATGVLANDFSPDSTPLAAVLDTAPSRGTVELSANGSFSYTPEAGFTGTDAFSYHAVSEGRNSNNVFVTITVIPADAGFLINPGFESDFTGWSVTGNTSVEFYQPTEGIKVADFNSENRTPDGTISQSFVTNPGTLYTLELDVGVISYTGDSQTLGVAVSGSGVLLSQSVTVPHVNGSVVRWLSRSFTFLADSTSSTLTLRDLSTATVGIDLLVDNIRITESAALMPQPAAVAELVFDLGVPAMRLTDTECIITYHTPASGNYVLERSSNLKDWERIDSTTSDGLELKEFREFRADLPDGPVYYRMGRETIPAPTP